MTCLSISKKTIDMTGQRIGKLTVVEYAGSDKNKAIWKCACDCGSTTVVTGNALRTGKVKSCGCLRTDKKKEVALKRDYPRLYNVWNSMRRRCNDERNHKYPMYGGRGIKVCDEWNTFENFLNWALDTGYDSTAKYSECTIDRIDTDSNYEPGNCRWVNAKAQANNTRKNRKITIGGETKTFAEWERKYGLPHGTICKRLLRNWGEEEAVLTPLHGKK